MEDKLYEAARVKGTEFPYRNSDADFILQRNLDDCNALHIAAQYGNRDFMKKVSDTFSSQFYRLLCQQNSKKETPLHLAAQSGDKNTVEFLLSAHVGRHDQEKPCWDVTDNKGETPLHRALRYRHEETSILLLERNRGLVYRRNHLGESPAYLAADNFCFKFLQTTDLDSSLDDPNDDGFLGPLGQTVFHPARKLTGDVMSILIEKRRDKLTVQDQKGKTVLHYAVEEKRGSIVKILLEAKSSLAYLHDDDGLTPLHRAAMMGLYSMVQIILELSPQSVFIRTSTNQTALHVAKMDTPAFAGCVRNTRLKELINVADEEGNTPLHLASKSSNLDIVDALLEVGGINWRLRNNDGYTPMDLFNSTNQYPNKLHVLESEWKEKEVINMNIFHRHDVKNLEDLRRCEWEDLMSYRGHKGNTILHIASRNGCKDIIIRARESSSACLLLLTGENSKGETPLHIAAEYGQWEVVKLILKRCISTDESGNETRILVVPGHDEYEAAHFKPWRMRSTNGDTPLHKAIRNGHAKVALHLLRCDPGLASYVNKASESVLYLAAQSRSYDVVRAILVQTQYQYNISGPGGKNPFHAAVISSGSYSQNLISVAAPAINSGLSSIINTSITACCGDKDMLIIMTEKLPGVVNKIDHLGKTPLHYAVEQQNHIIVEKLLQHDKSAAFVYDNEGFTPLLRATANDFDLCVESILHYCPHSAELRDVINNGTALHLIKKSNYPIHLWKKSNLFNESDGDGNTALHRAILDGKIDWAMKLVAQTDTNTRVRNNKQHTPFTLCHELTRNGDRSKVILSKHFSCIENGLMDQITNSIGPRIRHMLRKLFPAVEDLNELIFGAGSYIEGLKEEELKQFVNNMTLTATLLVTLTFAAAFTVPGGYDQNTGKVLRIKQVSVRMFLGFDAVAMLLGMGALLTYTFGSASSNKSLKAVAVEGSAYLRVSLVATIAAFAAGIHALSFNDISEVFIITVIVGISVVVNSLLRTALDC